MPVGFVKQAQAFVALARMQILGMEDWYRGYRPGRRMRCDGVPKKPYGTVLMRPLKGSSDTVPGGPCSLWDFSLISVWRLFVKRKQRIARHRVVICLCLCVPLDFLVRAHSSTLRTVPCTVSLVRTEPNIWGEQSHGPTSPRVQAQGGTRPCVLRGGSGGLEHVSNVPKKVKEKKTK